MANYISWHKAPLITANTTKDGTSGELAKVVSARDGELYVSKLVFRAAGTNVATVARVFINNGQDSTKAANNVLFAEITLDATTVSETAAQVDEELELALYLPKGYQILVAIGTAGTDGWAISAVGSGA